MDSTQSISPSKAAKILCLFFVLSVASVALVYSNFEQGVEDFWQDKDVSVLEEIPFDDLIDLDTLEPQGGKDISSIDSLALEYMETQGDVDVFEELFRGYIE